MTHTYLFPEAGTISGIPGTFAGVQVEVDEESNQITRVSPLARHPHFQASQEPDEQASEPEKPSEQETESTEQEKPPAQPEQEASPTEQSAEMEAEQPPTEAGHASLASRSVQSVQTEAAPLAPEQSAQTEAPTDVAPPADEAGNHTESEGV